LFKKKILRIKNKAASIQYWRIFTGGSYLKVIVLVQDPFLLQIRCKLDLYFHTINLTFIESILSDPTGKPIT